MVQNKNTDYKKPINLANVTYAPTGKSNCIAFLPKPV